jgi:hypothetical protein
MKYIFIFLFLPFAVKAQDKIADSLHKYTDSFMFYRCQVRCHKSDNTGFYINKREKYRELAQQYFNQFDPNRTKTKVRFRDPNHYFACPCQAGDQVMEQMRDSLDYYREEWEFTGRKPDANYKRMLYFNILFRNRFDEKMKKP